MLKSISTFSLFTQRNANLRELEAKLARTLEESSTTRKSDVAEAIGREISILNQLRTQQGENEAFLSSINAFERRSEFTSNALVAIDASLNSLIEKTVLNAPQAGDTIGALGLAAESTINEVVDALNTSVDGRFLFSGIDVDALSMRRAGEVNPLTGLSPNDVAAGILDGTAYAPAQPPAFVAFTAAEAATAITRFTEVFDGTNAGLGPPTENYSFERTLYDGALGGPAVSVRVGNGAPLDYGVSAEDAAFRTALQGAYMLSSVDLQTLKGTEAYEPYVTAALDLMTTGLTQLRDMTAQLGETQVDVEARKAVLETQNLALNLQIDAYEVADPIETQSLVNEIEKQLDAAYAATVRASRLSLTNYL